MKGKLAVLAFLAAGAVAAGPASATPPTRLPLPLEPSTFPAGQVCSFPVEVEAMRNKEMLTAFPDGRLRVTGVLTVRLTNADNGRSIVVNASGPSSLDTNTGEGPQLVFLFPGDVGGPGIRVFYGRIAFTFDDMDNIVAIDYTGRRSGDLCNAIA